MGNQKNHHFNMEEHQRQSEKKEGTLLDVYAIKSVQNNFMKIKFQKSGFIKFSLDKKIEEKLRQKKK